MEHRPGDANPGEPAAAFAHGNTSAAAGDLDAAIASYRRALAGDGTHVGALNNLGALLRVTGQPVAALACLRRAAALDGRAGTLVNIALVLLELHRPAQAIAALHQATRVDPGLAEAWSTLGGAELALGRLDAALAGFGEATRRAPDLFSARFGTALALLARGDWDAGWAAYDCRWDDPDRPVARPQPIWRGEDVAGRTVLLRAEQGFGDTIQFGRYVPLVAARGARVVLQVPAPLVRLLAPLADVVVALGAPVPHVDMACALLDLPRLFGTRSDRVPPPAPLAPDPALVAAWGVRLGPAAGPRIAVAFAGRDGDADDALRSIGAGELLAALAGSGADLHVAQPVSRASDAAAVAALPFVRAHDAALDDFAATAALLAHMDLVVSVDTAAAHLAASIGRPTWILLSHAPDFRWLRDRDDTPWYPSARLFRQPAQGDWTSVLEAVAQAAAVSRRTRREHPRAMVGQGREEAAWRST